MYVKKMIATGWQTFADEPTWPDVELEIRGMNGDDRSDLMLVGDNEASTLTIGGGKGGWYVVSLTHDNVRFHHLLERQPSSGRIEMLIGGEPDVRDLQRCVRLETLLPVAQDFYERGQPLDAANWFIEGPSDFEGRMGRGAGRYS